MVNVRAFRSYGLRTLFIFDFDPFFRLITRNNKPHRMILIIILANEKTSSVYTWMRFFIKRDIEISRDLLKVFPIFWRTVLHCLLYK